MQQRYKDFVVRKSLWVALFLFVATQLGDIITTLIVINKHGIEFEAMPLLVAGIPFWVLVLLKLFAIGIILWTFLKNYSRFNIYIRYCLVYFLVFIVVLFTAILINNIEVIKMPVGSIQPLPDEEKITGYQQHMFDMKAIESATPEKARIPFALFMFVWNLLTFVLWVDVEKGFKK